MLKRDVKLQPSNQFVGLFMVQRFELMLSWLLTTVWDCRWLLFYLILSLLLRWFGRVECIGDPNRIKALRWLVDRRYIQGRCGGSLRGFEKFLFIQRVCTGFRASSSVLLFWYAPLGVPEDSLSQVDFFIQCEVVGSQITLDSVQPRDTRTPWWSFPVLWWGSH